MKKLEEVYTELKLQKKQRAEIQKMFKDELAQVERYGEINEAMALLREEKKSIENGIRAEAQSDLDKLDELKVEIATNQEMMADIALNMYVKSETVEIIDEYDQAWYPEFKVAFKKL